MNCDLCVKSQFRAVIIVCCLKKKEMTLLLKLERVTDWLCNLHKSGTCILQRNALF
jgi:hypothetical protein